MTSIKPEYLRILGSVILFTLAMSLRVDAVNNTVIDEPINADATDYYTYAVHLKYHHTYSREKLPSNDPQPDALRTPGYPVFLVPFVKYPPTESMLWRIELAQALLDSITVLLALSIFRKIMAEGWALGAGFLTAISPHLISSTTYLLTETLFTFLMVLALWLAVKMIQNNSRTLGFVTGLVIAAAALTRPTLQFFIVPLAGMLLLTRGRGNIARLIIPLLAGFVLAFTPWVVRNLNIIGSTSDPTLMINSLYHGMYPDFRYKDNPESTGFPYRFDPRSEEISSSRESVLNEILRRFKEEPARHLRWYLLGKPASLFSWNILAGMGDIFIYPVSKSPYFSQPVYILSHKYMELLHWPLVLLAVFVSIAVWLPGSGKRLSGTALFTVRMLSLVMLYFIALHIVAAPFPRYGIPLRPVIYGLALFMCSQVVLWLKSALGREPVQPPAQAGQTPTHQHE
jgi:4-amino-4-deoxy-L-arabinose transferase-like glycosyltransferase